MNYYDPARPKQSNGLPMYFDDVGPVAPLPMLCMSWNEDGTLTASAMLLDSPNVGAWYKLTLEVPDNITDLLADWWNDPESVLRNLFKWPGMTRTAKTYAATAPKPDVTILSADDL